MNSEFSDSIYFSLCQIYEFHLTLNQGAFISLSDVIARPQLYSNTNYSSNIQHTREFMGNLVIHFFIYQVTGVRWYQA